MRPTRWLTPTERAQVVARFRVGARVAEVDGRVRVAAGDGVSDQGRGGVVASAGGGDSPRRLSFEDRERILVGIAGGESDSEIARALGRHRSTVGREIRRCGGRRRDYRSLAAERVADRLAARPKASKLSRCPRLVAAVEQGLEQGWSPEQISARLKADHPDDREMRISHETIYQTLFVQSRGELRKQLTVQLRTGRTRRKPPGRGPQTRGRIPGMVSICAAARGHRGPCGAGALGGRSDLGGVRPVCDRDAGGAPDPVCAARPARERPHDRACRHGAERAGGATPAPSSRDR